MSVGWSTPVSIRLNLTRKSRSAFSSRPHLREDARLRCRDTEAASTAPGGGDARPLRGRPRPARRARGRASTNGRRIAQCALLHRHCDGLPEAANGRRSRQGPSLLTREDRRRRFLGSPAQRHWQSAELDRAAGDPRLRLPLLSERRSRELAPAVVLRVRRSICFPGHSRAARSQSTDQHTIRRCTRQTPGLFYWYCLPNRPDLLEQTQVLEADRQRDGNHHARRGSSAHRRESASH